MGIHNVAQIMHGSSPLSSVSPLGGPFLANTIGQSALHTIQNTLCYWAGWNFLHNTPSEATRGSRTVTSSRAQRFRYRHFHVSRRECQILQCSSPPAWHNRSYYSFINSGNFLLSLRSTPHWWSEFAYSSCPLTTICCRCCIFLAAVRSFHAPCRRIAAQNRLKKLFSFFCLELLLVEPGWFPFSRFLHFEKGRSSIQSSITHDRCCVAILRKSRAPTIPSPRGPWTGSLSSDHRAPPECANQRTTSVCQVCVTSVSG